MPSFAIISKVLSFFFKQLRKLYKTIFVGPSINEELSYMNNHIPAQEVYDKACKSSLNYMYLIGYIFFFKLSFLIKPEYEHAQYKQIFSITLNMYSKYNCTLTEVIAV